MMHNEFICKNAMIDEGPPKRYQLKLKVENLDGDEEDSRLIRCTLGEKDPLKPNKTILLVGETGSGKSTLINTFLNYVMGVKNKNNAWFEIVDESKKNSRRSVSQTSKVTVYELFGFEGETVPYSLTIIDTPGYGDTRGIENDAIVAHKLHDLFRSEEGIQEINVVGLVLKASENRLSDRLMYIFNSIVSLFGKDVEEKIVALITHSDGMPPTAALQALQDANIKCAKNERGQAVHFVFNNCLSTKITEDTEFGLQQAWAVTMRGMKQFTAFLDVATPQKLEKTVIVLNERIRLAACINNLTDKIDLLKKKQEQIIQTQEALQKHDQTLTGESFTLEVDEPYKIKEDIDGGMWLLFFGGAVTCSVCEENCHYPGCTLAWYPKHCEVMKKGKCTVCTKKCPADVHVKEKKKYVTKTRKVQKTIEKSRKIYEANQKESESLLTKLKKEKENLEKETNILVDEAYDHLVTLESIALTIDLVFSFVQFDVLIEEMKKRGDIEKVTKLEEITGRINKGIFSALRYKVVHVGAKVWQGIKNSNFLK